MLVSHFVFDLPLTQGLLAVDLLSPRVVPLSYAPLSPPVNLLFWLEVYMWLSIPPDPCSFFPRDRFPCFASILADRLRALIVVNAAFVFLAFRDLTLDVSLPS